MFTVGSEVEFKIHRHFQFTGAMTSVFIGTPATITSIEDDRIYLKFHDGIQVSLSQQEATEQLRIRRKVGFLGGDHTHNPKLDNDWSVHVGGVADFNLGKSWNQWKTMNFKQAAAYVSAAIKGEFERTGKIPSIEIYWQNWGILEFVSYTKKFYWQDADYKSQQGYYVLRAMQAAVKECTA